MAKQLMETATLYVPQGKVKERYIERMIAVGAKKDRSFNYVLIEAVKQYLEREEAKGA